MLVVPAGTHFDFAWDRKYLVLSACAQDRSPQEGEDVRSTVKVERGEETLNLELFPQPMQISLVLNTAPSCLSFSKHRGALSPPFQVSLVDSKFVD